MVPPKILYGKPIFKNLSSNSLVWKIALTRIATSLNENLFLKSSILEPISVASSFTFLKQFKVTSSPSSWSVKSFFPTLFWLFSIIFDATFKIFWVDL